ncbi:MAG: AraC-like DNA-binding protein [Bradymonadia bacterium]|jgi:AraC-like DNA-binding protein
MSRTIAAVIVRNTLRIAQTDGIDCSAWAAQIRLDAAGDDPLHPLDLDVFLDAYGDIVRRLDDPSWPVRLAQRLEPGDYSVVGFAIMTAATGYEALQRALRYQQLFCPASSWQMQVDDDIQLTWLRAGPPTLGHRTATEGVLAEFVQTSRQMFATLALREVTFRHARPRDTSAHDAFFGCPVRFNADADTVRFSAEDMTRAPADANPAMAAWFANELDQRVAAQQIDIAAQVERRLLHRLASGTPSVADVAQDLGMSPRTLRRRLSDAGTGFAVVLDGLRQREAAHLLRCGRSSVGEVSWMLGFSDASAFTRACRRWFGVSPRAYASA